MMRCHNGFIRVRRVRVVGLLLAGLIAQLLVGRLPAASATSPSGPTGIDTSVSTSNPTLGTPQGLPNVLATPGSPFTVQVDLVGGTFTKDTVLNLISNTGKSFSSATVKIGAGQTVATIQVSYPAVVNQLTVTAVEPVKGNQVAPTPHASLQFDIVKTLNLVDSSEPNFGNGIGVGVGNADCTQATTETTCGILLLPNGAGSAQVALSLGACSTALGCTSAKGEIVQFVGDLSGRYTKQAPATMIVRCDKSVCSGSGVNKYTVKGSLLPSPAVLAPLPACTAKGVIDQNVIQCTDYVQSHRDNAGDLLLYVLTTQDARYGT